MLMRHRLSYAALGGCLAVVLWGNSALGQTGEPKSKAVAPQPKTEQSQPVKQLPPPLPKQKPQAKNYKGLCDQPQSPKESDLCQQWRMAEAAEKQAKWTVRLFWVTVIEIFALIATITVAAWAAIAATHAAKAAREAIEPSKRQAEISEKIFSATYRPWVGVTATSGLALVIGPMPRVGVTIRNTGLIPAMRVRANFLGGFSYETPDAPESVLGSAFSSVLMPNTNYHYFPFSKGITITKQQLSDIASGKQKLWIVGCVEYSDALENRYRTIMRMEFINGYWEACQDGNEAN